MSSKEKKQGIPEKISLTLEQINILGNVFNLAVGYIEVTQHNIYMLDKNSEAVLINKKDILKQIDELFWYLEKHIEVKDE